MEKAQVAAMDAQMEHDRRRGLEEEAAQEYRRRLNQVDARLVIEQQLIEKERAKFFQGEREAQRDKAMVDSIVSKIQSEDAAEAADRAKRKAESQKFIAAFKEEQAGWKRAQAEAEAAEERRIAEYAAAQERREAAVAAQKAEAEAAKDAIYGKLVDEQKERQRQLDEEDMLRMLLAEEENELRLEAAERAVRREDAEGIWGKARALVTLTLTRGTVVVVVVLVTILAASREEGGGLACHEGGQRGTDPAQGIPCGAG